MVSNRIVSRLVIMYLLPQIFWQGFRIGGQTFLIRDMKKFCPPPYSETLPIFFGNYMDASKSCGGLCTTILTLLLLLLNIGGILMFGAVVLFDDEFIHIVSISFTALILTELIMIALTVRTWHWAMVVAEVTSLFVYLISVLLYPAGFGKCHFKNIVEIIM